MAVKFNFQPIKEPIYSMYNRCMVPAAKTQTFVSEIWFSTTCKSLISASNENRNDLHFGEDINVSANEFSNVALK